MTSMVLKDQLRDNGCPLVAPNLQPMRSKRKDKEFALKA